MKVLTYRGQTLDHDLVQLQQRRTRWELAMICLQVPFYAIIFLAAVALLIGTHG